MLIGAAHAAGGVRAARLVSVAERGRPHPFYPALTAVEFLAPGRDVGAYPCDSPANLLEPARRLVTAVDGAQDFPPSRQRFGQV